MNASREITSIAVDWGTSNLRCWGLSPELEVLGEADSNDGLNRIAREKGDFESALLHLVDPWLGSGTTPVVACGMVGARNGWCEVPYRDSPCPARLTAKPIPSRSSRIRVMVVPGVSQSSPADVMRGEETQIAGLLSTRPDFAGMVCLTGTHAKWVEVASGGVLQCFRTFPTGEWFSLLALESTLRFTLAPDGFDEPSFLESLQFAFSKPGEVPSECFALRAEALLHDLDGITARSRLSGLLIGQEFAGARSMGLLRDSITLIGAPPLVNLYRSGLESLDCRVAPFDAEELSLAGLRSFFSRGNAGGAIS